MQTEARYIHTLPMRQLWARLARHTLPSDMLYEAWRPAAYDDFAHKFAIEWNFTKVDVPAAAVKRLALCLG